MALDAASMLRQHASYRRVCLTAEHASVFTKSGPLVTVIMPTYNRAGLLRERSLKSVLNQSYTNLEVLVVGDACTDDSAEAVASFRDPRVRFVNLEGRPDYLSKGGWYCLAIRPMNRGLELATGDFITGLDDDDEYMPDRIKILVEMAQKYSADFLFHSFRYEVSPGNWSLLGSKDGKVKFGGLNNSTVFYHRYFKNLHYDWDCWVLHKEPADWNRFRKISEFNPKTVYVHTPLLVHYIEGTAGFGNGGGGVQAKLHLYCGSQRLKNWVNVDPRIEAKSDLTADPALEMPIAEGGAEIILCPAPPELERNGALALLGECSRALKIGGILVFARASAEAAYPDVVHGMRTLGFEGLRPYDAAGPPEGVDPEAAAVLAAVPCWQATRFDSTLLDGKLPASDRFNISIAPSRDQALIALWKNFMAPGSMLAEGRAHLEKAQAALDSLDEAAASFSILNVPGTLHAPPGIKVTVYAASRGTAFNIELRDALVANLARQGCAAMAGDEADFPPNEAIKALVVAPHEFYSVSSPFRELLVRRRSPGRMLMVNTAPLASAGFKVMLALLNGDAFLQCDPQSVAVLRAFGYPAYFLPPAFPLDRLLPLPAADSVGVHLDGRTRRFLPDELGALSARPLDVLSLNDLTNLVRQRLCVLAPALSARNCMLIYNQVNARTMSTEPALIASGLAQRAKILLHLRPDRTGFDGGAASLWSGWLGGALVLSEPGCKVPGMEAGEHYVECGVEKIPEALDYYLDSTQGRLEAETIRANARVNLAGVYPPDRLVRGLMTLLAAEG